MGFKVGTVFDVSQTDGDPLPEICHKLKGGVAEYDNILSALKTAAKIPVEIREIKPEEGEANGWYNGKTNAITIRSGMSQAQTIKTLCHEMGHSILHCSGGKQEKADRETCELQAESVAYIVCNYLGIDSGDWSFGYIASWSKGKSTRQLEKNMAAIGDAAMEIIKRLEAME